MIGQLCDMDCGRGYRRVAWYLDKILKGAKPAARIAEIDLHTGVDGELDMLGHLPKAERRPRRHCVGCDAVDMVSWLHVGQFGLALGREVSRLRPGSQAVGPQPSRQRPGWWRR